MQLGRKWLYALENGNTTSPTLGFGNNRVRYHEVRRFVDNGRIITSAGIAAGIDMSLHVVERLLSQEVAVTTARHMEYPWGNN